MHVETHLFMDRTHLTREPETPVIYRQHEPAGVLAVRVSGSHLDTGKTLMHYLKKHPFSEKFVFFRLEFLYL